MIERKDTRNKLLYKNTKPATEEGKDKIKESERKIQTRKERKLPVNDAFCVEVEEAMQHLLHQQGEGRLR